MFKKILNDYFSFGKRDRMGVIALVLLIGIIYLLPRFFSRSGTSSLQWDEVAQAVDSLDRRSQDSGDRRKKRDLTAGENSEFGDFERNYRFEPARQGGFREGELFSFDPNTLSAEGWQRLGLNEKTSLTIEKFRNKGGKFYHAEDLRKIWGMPEGFYERVKRYVAIPSSESKRAESGRMKSGERERKVISIDINSADTTAWIALPGIGSKLAMRVVSFREKLGGFYSVDQVREIYGLADSIFQKIKLYLEISGEVKKFNLNTVTKDELKAHPYFKWNLANAIVERRNQHGNYKSLDELLKIALIDEVLFEKIRNYLVME